MVRPGVRAAPSAGMEPVELIAGPWLLRPWDLADVDAVWAALQDPEVRRWNSTGSTTREDAAVFVARRRDWSAGDHASWAVVEDASAVLLGSVSVHSIDAAHANAQIGYWTVPAARGRGVASAAVATACAWAFDSLAVDRIELCHAVGNPASGRVAEKAGFAFEGRLRRSFRYGDGVKHDELLWARLADDPAPAPADGAR